MNKYIYSKYHKKNLSGLLMPQLIIVTLLMTPKPISFAAVSWDLRVSTDTSPMKKTEKAQISQKCRRSIWNWIVQVNNLKGKKGTQFP